MMPPRRIKVRVAADERGREDGMDRASKAGAVEREGWGTGMDQEKLF